MMLASCDGPRGIFKGLPRACIDVYFTLGSLSNQGSSGFLELLLVVRGLIGLNVCFVVVIMNGERESSV
jgi:hypothetical protein